jgi:hypothetical protein
MLRYRKPELGLGEEKDNRFVLFLGMEAFGDLASLLYKFQYFADRLASGFRPPQVCQDM